MSESMMVQGQDRIAVNTAVPTATPIGNYPTTVSQVVAQSSLTPMTPMVNVPIPTNVLLFLAVGCILLIGAIAGILVYQSHSKKNERSVKFAVKRYE